MQDENLTKKTTRRKKTSEVFSDDAISTAAKNVENDTVLESSSDSLNNIKSPYQDEEVSDLKPKVKKEKKVEETVRDELKKVSKKKKFTEEKRTSSMLQALANRDVRTIKRLDPSTKDKEVVLSKEPFKLDKVSDVFVINNNPPAPTQTPQIIQAQPEVTLTEEETSKIIFPNHNQTNKGMSSGIKSGLSGNKLKSAKNFFGNSVDQYLSNEGEVSNSEESQDYFQGDEIQKNEFILPTEIVEQIKSTVKEVSGASARRPDNVMVINPRPINYGKFSFDMSWKKFFYLIIVMLGFVAAGYLIYQLVFNKSKTVLEQVSSSIMVPVSETPQVFIVQESNVNLFTDKVFKDVKIGDTVVVYKASAKMIVYRSSIQKVILVVPTGGTQ